MTEPGNDNRAADAGLLAVNIALVAVFFLGTAFGGLSVRSYFVSDRLEWADQQDARRLWILQGKFCGQSFNEPYSVTPSQELRYEKRPAGGLNKNLPWWRHWWIHWQPGPMDDPVNQIRDRVLSVPLWIPFLAFAIVPGLAVLWARRRLNRAVLIPQ